MGAVVLLVLLLLASPASAAETVIGFDHFPGGGEVPAGTEAGAQWESEGLRLGKAEEFGRASVAGNCGKPAVQRETAVAASSPPNYAVLATCFGAFNTEGTFGALSAPARGSVSVEVRIVNSAAPVGVILRGYNSSGSVVAEGHGEANSGAWQRVSATSGAGAQISYFAIATELVTSQEVAIDDLGFETPPMTGGSGGGGTPPPPGSTPPTASLALTTPDPHAGEPLTLSGAGSTPGGGRIVSYGWNFRGGEKEETSTGTDPNAQIMLGPGAHTITLIVTTSKHESATTHLGVVLPTTLKAHLPDGGEGECKPTLEIGDAHLLAECIQKLGEGYVIEGQLEINGMLLVPRSGFLKIKTVKTLGVGTETELYGAVVDVELANTPVGTMVLGERDLEAEPIPLEVHTYVPPKFEGVFHGFRGRAARRQRRRGPVQRHATTVQDAPLRLRRRQELQAGLQGSGVLPAAQRAHRLRRNPRQLPDHGSRRRLPDEHRQNGALRAGRPEPEGSQPRSDRRARNHGQQREAESNSIRCSSKSAKPR